MPGTRIIARVGTEYVLEGDVIGQVNDLIERNKERIPKDQLEKVREELTRQRLENLLQTKIILCDCRAKIPAEGFKKFSEKLGQNFDEEEVPKAMEKEGASRGSNSMKSCANMAVRSTVKRQPMSSGKWPWAGSMSRPRATKK